MTLKPGAAGLTRREWEIAELVHEGLASHEIGARLHISPRTVQAHVQNVYSKLHIRNRIELSQWMSGQKTAPMVVPDDVALVRDIVATWMLRLPVEERPAAVLRLVQHLTQSG